MGEFARQNKALIPNGDIEQTHGRKDCILTRGDRTDTPSDLGNLSSDGQLNGQKSAEVIVQERVAPGLEGPKRVSPLDVLTGNGTDNPKGLTWRRKW